MPACPYRVVSRFTAVLAADAIDATARRTGVVKRASTMTGTLWLALVTCGTWREAQTTVAPWAAQGTPLDTPGEGSPAARHPRLHQQAMAVLQDMSRQALANVPSLERVGDEGRLTHCPHVYLADRTGVERPEALHTTVPGSGGSAANAGANMHAVWDETSRVWGHVALTPWHMPAQPYLDPGVACAPQGRRCIVECGDVTRTACSRLATAGASVFSRRHHQTTLVTTAAGRWHPVELARWLTTAAGQLLARPMFLGAQARVAARLRASRVPEASVKARRRPAKQQATNNGSTPAQAHLTRLAWNRLMTHVPHTRWQTATVVNVSPWRWHIERMLTSWQSDRHCAVLTTTTEDPTWCELEGRLRRMVRTSALGPPRRAHRWGTNTRELSRLKRVRHVQALAARGRQAIVQAARAGRRLLTHACHTAARWVAKALRTRRTTAHILRAHVRRHEASSTGAEAVNASRHAYGASGAPGPRVLGAA